MIDLDKTHDIESIEKGLAEIIDASGEAGISGKKKVARMYFRRVRDGIPPEECAEQSEAVCRMIASMPEFMQAEYVFVYRAIGSEVSLYPLCQTAWRMGKMLPFPKCVRDEAGEPALDWYAVRSAEDADWFERGSYGIMEPNEKRLPKLNMQSLDPKKALAVVPGLAFDHKGARLGYGCGYYDRFLSQFRPYTVGASYNETCIDDLAAAGLMDPHDIPLDAVVTPSREFLMD
jgi:5-formyltetrahydrofolate cyclo-ligase